MLRHRISGRPTAKRLAASLALALLALGGAQAEELSTAFIAANGDALVSRVSYEGAKRTRASALQELTGLKVGMRLSEIDPEAIKQSVLKSGIFSAIELSAVIEEGQAAVTVVVKEKWSFIPIPAASFGSEGWSAGLTLLEYNFLGLRKTLVLSGSDSNLGWSGIIAYSDPRFLHSRASFRAFASGKSSSKEARYMDGASYAAYDEKTADGGLSLVYPSEGKLSAELDLTLRYSGIGADTALRYGLFQESLALIPGLALNYDGRRFVGYRNEGALANATYTHSFGIEGMPSADSIEASGELDLTLSPWLVLELGAVGHYGTRNFQGQGSLSGMGFRTLPQGYSFSAKNAAAYVDLALPFLKLGWSVMEIFPFYEGGLYATGLIGERLDAFHGPGIGYRLYLRDIALPAVGINAAYNLPAKKFVVSANVGVSF
jgi:outer membrane protein assembly factor BamA